MSETVRGEQLCMDMGRAVTDCVPRPVADDVWTQVARHGPGQRRGRVSTTNRSIVYRLRPDGGAPFLVLLNGLWVDEDADQPFAGLRALEEETGCRLRFVLAPGSSSRPVPCRHGPAPATTPCSSALRPIAWFK